MVLLEGAPTIHQVGLTARTINKGFDMTKIMTVYMAVKGSMIMKELTYVAAKYAKAKVFQTMDQHDPCFSSPRPPQPSHWQKLKVACTSSPGGFKQKGGVILFHSTNFPKHGQQLV